VVVALVPPLVSVSDVDTTGDTLSTPDAVARSWASVSVRSAVDWAPDAAPAAKNAPAPSCRTVSEFVPSELRLFWIAWDEPLPTATSRMTEPTPIRMPRQVSAERSLFDYRPASANLSTWPGFMTAPPSA
jgi:hypothetical protein